MAVSGENDREDERVICAQHIWRRVIAPALALERVDASQQARDPRLWVGRAFWGGEFGGRRVRVSWAWAEIAHGILAIADPGSIEANVVFVDRSGREMGVAHRMLFLNETVHNLPWQRRVMEALAEDVPHDFRSGPPAAR